MEAVIFPSSMTLVTLGGLLALVGVGCTTVADHRQGNQIAGPAQPEGHLAVYFSPEGGCESHVVDLIRGAKATLDVAIYAINNDAIVRALEDAKGRGVRIRILIDRVQASGAGNRETTLKLKAEGFDVRIHSKNKIQHNKFVVADGSRVETGSFNWTTPAEHSNEENCLFIDDAAVAASYEKRFTDHLWIVNTPEKSDKAFDKLELKQPGARDRTEAGN